MARVLRIGGRGLVYVWAKDQKNNKKLSSYLKQNRKNLRDNIDCNSDLNSNISTLAADNIGCVKNEFSLPVHVNRTQFEHEDLLVPWKLKTNKEKVFYRYYHVFKEGELENLFLSVADVKVIKSFYDQGNWCILFEKIN